MMLLLIFKVWGSAYGHTYRTATWLPKCFRSMSYQILQRMGLRSCAFDAQEPRHNLTLGSPHTLKFQPLWHFFVLWLWKLSYICDFHLCRTSCNLDQEMESPHLTKMLTMSIYHCFDVYCSLTMVTVR